MTGPQNAPGTEKSGPSPAPIRFTAPPSSPPGTKCVWAPRTGCASPEPPSHNTRSQDEAPVTAPAQGEHLVSNTQSSGNRKSVFQLLKQPELSKPRAEHQSVSWGMFPRAPAAHSSHPSKGNRDSKELSPPESSEDSEKPEQLRGAGLALSHTSGCPHPRQLSQ